MSFDRTQIRLRFVGHFGSSPANQLDHWSAGLRLAVVGGAAVTNGDLTTFLETISGPVASFHGGASSMSGSSCYLDSINAAPLGLDGKYPSKATLTTVRDYTTPVSGSGTSLMPWNTALVTSLRTLNKRGYASNGRMYWPATSASCNNLTGRLTTTQTANYITTCKTMMDAINAAAQTLQSGLRIHVMSAVGSGTSSLVTQIRVDQRLDSIERRENDQPAVYSVASLA